MTRMMLPALADGDGQSESLSLTVRPAGRTIAGFCSVGYMISEPTSEVKFWCFLPGLVCPSLSVCLSVCMVIGQQARQDPPGGPDRLRVGLSARRRHSLLDCAVSVCMSRRARTAAVTLLSASPE